MTPVVRHQHMDAYTRSDRRRARLALVLLVLALCERASEAPEGAAPFEDKVIAQANGDAGRD